MALDIPVCAQPLSNSVVAARDAAERQNKTNAATVAPRIEAHLKAGRIAIETLRAAHQHIGDQTDLDLAGDTRQAAVWIVAGRCLGLSSALMDLLDSGYGAEAMPTARALHEATRLLDAFTDDGDDSLLTRWLADEDQKWVRPKETRQAREDMISRLRVTMAESLQEAEAADDVERVAQLTEAIAGMDATPDGHLWRMSLSIYDVLSRIGHTRRSGTRDSVSAPLRQMVTGPHPDPLIRGEYVEWSIALIEEVMLSVGDALGRFVGPSYFKEIVHPIISALHAVRAAHPLTT
jgi:hypothetical protein